MASSPRVQWPPDYFVLMPVVLVLVILAFMALDSSAYNADEQVDPIEEIAP